MRIDNNPVERGIRPTKLRMKNWLFIGHPSAGWRSAVIYSIVGSCKLIHVNPEAYLAGCCRSSPRQPPPRLAAC